MRATPSTLAETFLQNVEILFQAEICRNDLETDVECYRVLANWGVFPPNPPRRACRPPLPPAKTPLLVHFQTDRRGAIFRRR